MILLMLRTALAADCATHPTDTELLAETQAIESALAAADPQRFTDGMNRLNRMLGCVDSPVQTATMARVRLFRGIQAFGDNDLDLAASEFLAARALAPDLSIPVYPSEHEIYGVFTRYDPIRAPRSRLPAPRRGSLLVDGYETRDRYTDAPALVQLIDDRSVKSFLLSPAELPHYPIRHPIRNGLLITGGTLALAGGGLIIASQGAHTKFNNAHTLGDLNALRSETNTLAAGGLGLVTAGVISTAFAVIFRDR